MLLSDLRSFCFSLYVNIIPRDNLFLRVKQNRYLPLVSYSWIVAGLWVHVLFSECRSIGLPQRIMKPRGLNLWVLIFFKSSV